jgi:predicted DNA-binding protein with PD1-like motif
MTSRQYSNHAKGIHIVIVQELTANRHIMVRLDPGQDLLHGIEQAVKEAGITQGAILAGVGSLSSYHFHVVSTPVMPPENAFIKGEGPYDILTITGAILDGRVHAHVTFSDTEIAMGGHLEPGSTVLTFAMITIADFSAPGLEFAKWDHVAR